MKKILKNFYFYFFFLSISFFSTFLFLLFYTTFFLTESYYKEQNQLFSFLVKELDHHIDTNFQTLQNLSTLIGNTNLNSYESQLNFLNNQLQNNDFKCLGFISVDGKATCSRGKTNDFLYQDFFQSALEGKNTLSHIFFNENTSEPLNIYIIPIYSNKKITSLLYGTQSNQEISKILSSSLQNNASNISLLDKFGDPISKEKPLASQEQNNFFFELENVKILNNKDIYDIKLDFNYGHAGSFSFIYENLNYTCSYFPLKNSNLILVNTSPSISPYTIFSQNTSLYYAFFFSLLILFIFTCLFIFAQKTQSKKSIKKAQLNLNVLLNNVQAALIELKTDEYSTIQYINQGFIDLTGFNEEELHHKFKNRYVNLIHPSDLKRVNKFFLDQIKNQNSIECEYRILKKDGKYATILDKSILHFNNKGEEILYATLIDITDKQVSGLELSEKIEELRQSEMRYNLAMINSGIYVFEYIPSQKILITSEFAAKRFNLPMIVSDIPKGIFSLFNLNSETQLAITTAFKHIDKGEKKIAFNIATQSQNNQIISLKITMASIFDSHGIPIRTIGTTQIIQE